MNLEPRHQNSVWRHCAPAALRPGDARSAVRARGVTLPELLIVVLVVAVLGAMAAPVFTSFTTRGGITAAEAEFVNALNYSRSEAMRRGVNVVVTASAPTSGVDSFGAGWSLWADLNGNGTLDSGEPVIRTQPAFAPGVTLGSGAVNTVAFNSQGYLVSGISVSFSTCNSSNAGQQGYTITVLPGGIVDVADNVTC